MHTVILNMCGRGATCAEVGKHAALLDELLFCQFIRRRIFVTGRCLNANIYISGKQRFFSQQTQDTLQ
jgi:hypothetical protein